MTLIPTLADRYARAKNFLALADTYLEDGAPATAADRARRAAAEIDVIAQERQAALDALITETEEPS